MAVPKPTQTAEWASVAGPQIVEPPAPKKVQGWNAGERPPAQFMNWLQNLAHQWFEYINDLESQLLSFVEGIVFQKSVTVGADSPATEATAITDRLFLKHVVGFITKAFRMKEARVWVDGNASLSALIVTINADRVAGLWQKTASGTQALALYMQRDRLVFASMPQTQNTPWANAIVAGLGTVSGWGRLVEVPLDSTAWGVVTAGLVELAAPPMTRALLFEMRDATFGNLRIYRTATDGAGFTNSLDFVFNAKWDGALWAYDTTGVALRFVYSRTQRRALWNTGVAAATFGDGTWVKISSELLQTVALGPNLVQYHNGRIRFVQAQAVTGDDANPPAQAANLPSNTIHAKNILKSFGDVNFGASDVINDGYNLNATTPLTKTTTQVTVNFETPLDSSNYSVVINPQRAASATNFHICVLTARTASGFTFEYFTQASGVTTRQNPTVGTQRINYQVFGAQVTDTPAAS